MRTSFLARHLDRQLGALEEDKGYQRLVALARRECDKYLTESHEWVDDGRRVHIDNALRHNRRPLCLYLLYRLTGDARYADAVVRIGDWLIAQRKRTADLPISVFFADGMPAHYADGKVDLFETAGFGAPGYASTLVQLVEAMSGLDEEGRVDAERMRQLRWLIELECEKLGECVAPGLPLEDAAPGRSLSNMRFAFAVALLILREGFLGEHNPYGGALEQLARDIAASHRLVGGCHWERTASYNQMVAYSEILLWEYLHQRDGRPPTDLTPPIRRGFEWLLGMQRPDGRFSAFNDSVETISFGPLFWAAAAFEDGRFQRLALEGLSQAEQADRAGRCFDDRWAWKTGSWGIWDHALALLFYKPIPQAEASLDELEVDRDEGIVVVRPQGHGGTGTSDLLRIKPSNVVSSHRHEDAGLFEWWADGVPVFVDPGVRSYFARAHHEWLKTAMAHPTVARVEEPERTYDLAMYGLRGLVSHHRTQQVGQARDLDVQRGDACWRIAFRIEPYAGVVWRRGIVWEPGRRRLALEDDLTSDEPGTFDWLLPGLGDLPESVGRSLVVPRGDRMLHVDWSAEGCTPLVHRHEDVPGQATLALRGHGRRLRWSARLRVVQGRQRDPALRHDVRKVQR